MLTIRLQRAGKRNNPEFRLVLAEKSASAGKKFIEVLGSYNPHTKTLGIRNQERLQYWIAQHVSVSPSVYNLLISNNILTGAKRQAFRIPKKEAVKEETATVSQTTSEPAAEVGEPQTSESEATAPSQENQASEAPNPETSEETPTPV